VAGVSIEVLLGVGHGALMNCAVLSSSEVVHVLLTISGEVNRQTTSFNEGHAAALLLNLGASVNILLVGVSFALELHELSVFESLTEGPFNNFTVTGNGDKRLTLVLTLHPLDIPNDIGVLELQIFRLSNWCVVVGLDVVDGNVTTGVTNSTKMWGLSAERAADDAGVVLDQLFGEVRVLQGPEAKETGLQLVVISNVDISLTVTNSDQIRVSQVNVHAGNTSSFSEVTFECEKWLKCHLTFLNLLFLLLIVVFLGFVLLHHRALFLVSLFLIVVSVGLS